MTIISTLVGVTLRGLLSRRRLILLVLLAAVPVLIALLISVAGGRPVPDRVLDTLDRPGDDAIDRARSSGRPHWARRSRTGQRCSS